MGRERRLSKKRRGGLSIAPLDEEFIQKETFHRALACRTRLKIMAMLEQRAMFGYELVKRLGIGQSTVSYHLGILRRAGLIATQPQAEGILYSLVKRKAA